MTSNDMGTEAYIPAYLLMSESEGRDLDLGDSTCIIVRRVIFLYCISLTSTDHIYRSHLQVILQLQPHMLCLESATCVPSRARQPSDAAQHAESAPSYHLATKATEIKRIYIMTGQTSNLALAPINVLGRFFM